MITIVRPSSKKIQRREKSFAKENCSKLVLPKITKIHTELDLTKDVLPVLYSLAKQDHENILCDYLLHKEMKTCFFAFDLSKNLQRIFDSGSQILSKVMLFRVSYFGNCRKIDCQYSTSHTHRDDVHYTMGIHPHSPIELSDDSLERTEPTTGPPQQRLGPARLAPDAPADHDDDDDDPRDDDLLDDPVTAMTYRVQLERQVWAAADEAQKLRLGRLAANPPDAPHTRQSVTIADLSSFFEDIKEAQEQRGACERQLEGKRDYHDTILSPNSPYVTQGSLDEEQAGIREKLINLHGQILENHTSHLVKTEKRVRDAIDALVATVDRRLDQLSHDGNSALALQYRDIKVAAVLMKTQSLET